jgi:pyridoxal phosphate enzyme (YggS family)
VSHESPSTVLSRRLAEIEERIGSACARAGRARAEVSVIAVTKTVSAEVAAVLPELGLHELGESRPQELWRKAALLPATVRWHLIGHLQRNKIDQTLPRVVSIHSVDSLRLLAALDEAAGKSGSAPEVLLEVNASGEASKNGFAPEQVLTLVPAIGALRHLRVAGLMTMAAYEEDPERCRPTFVRLRTLRDQLQAELGPHYPLPQLSMGMSNDFEVAIEEGATQVRLGTILFEGLA